MIRLTLAALLTTFATPTKSEDLRSAFYALPKQERIEMQTQLSGLGLYDGVIDGLWGPGTAGAFAAAQDSLAWPAHQEMAQAMGITKPSEILWSYVAEPDLAASMASWRTN